MRSTIRRRYRPAVAFPGRACPRAAVTRWTRQKAPKAQRRPARSGAVANDRMPSSKSIEARKPSRAAARSVLATTWRRRVCSCWGTPMCWPSTTTTAASTARPSTDGAGGGGRLTGPIPRRGGGDDDARNETVVALNHQAQGHPGHAGEVDLAGPSVEAGGPTSCTSVMRWPPRRNHRELHRPRADGQERDRWEIRRSPRRCPDRRRSAGTVRLPADYVAEHVELAYAQTSHANQGRTVDRFFLFLDGPADTRGLRAHDQRYK